MKEHRITVNLEKKDYENLEEQASKKRISKSGLARNLIAKGLESEIEV